MKSVETAGVILLTDQSEVVMQRRDGGAPTGPNKLGLFGGHISKGEDPIDTVIRKVHEETSIPPEQISYQFIDLIHVPPSPGHDLANPCYIFLAHIRDWHFKVFEGKGAEKYKPQELFARTDLAWGTRHVLTHLKERNIWH